MKTSYISSMSVSQATRRPIMDLQAQLAIAQKEVASGRHADIGLAVGHRAGQGVDLRNDFARLKTIIDTNGLAAARLDTAQGALAGMLDTAQGFLDSLAVGVSGSADPALLADKAKQALTAFSSGLNVTFNGEYLFAGINVAEQPLVDYHAEPTGPARQAVADAFVAHFGFAQTDPAAANIAPADMEAFLQGPFAALFDDPAWGTNWSSASDKNAQGRIGPTETVATGTNANEAAFRKLAQALTMVADLGLDQLNDGAAQTVLAAAMEKAGEGIGGLATLQAQLGTAQERIARSNERMSLQADILTKQSNALETVDPYEAAVRVNTLITQIETSYALTGRLQNLTLLNFL